MKHLLIATLLLALPTVSLAQTTTTNTLELTGTKPGISAEGSKVVTIKDKAKITKTLDLRGALFNGKGDVKVKDTLRPTIDNAYNLGSATHFWATLFVNNITLPEGGLVDGVDVSALATQVQSVDEDLSQVQGLPECDGGEFPMRGEEGWECNQYSPTDEYDNVLTVAATGGNYTTITDAVNAINVMGDAALWNQYVIWVAPGVYAGNFTLPDYTDLVGSSRDGVIISGNNVASEGAAIVAGTTTSVSNVTITATGNTDVTAIKLDAGDSFLLDNATVYLSEITGDNARVIYNNGGTLTVKNSDISAGQSAVAAYGIDNVGMLTVTDTFVHLQNNNTANDLYGININTTSYDVVVKNTKVELAGSDDAEGAYNCYGMMAQLNGVELTIDGSEFNVDNCNHDERAAHMNGSNTSEARIFNSRFITGDTGDGNALTTFQIAARLSASLLKGGGETASAYNTCVGSFDESFNALTDGCEIIP